MIREVAKNKILDIFKKCIKIKHNDTIYYLYDKDMILRYKLSLLKNKPFNIENNIKDNINWANDKVIFEQTIHIKIFWVKYNLIFKILKLENIDFYDIKNILHNFFENDNTLKTYSIPI